jgi:tRNA U34 5-methylaminomethyl-2-thiouridine-forming methyltransferase MnmC
MAPHSVSVVPARLERREGGVPFSAEFGDVYHSIDGGLAQARTSFSTATRCRALARPRLLHHRRDRLSASG